MKRDSMAYTVLFTFLVCVFFVFFLSLANESTKDRVASNRRLAERSAVLSAMGIPYTKDTIDTTYEKSVSTVKASTGELYRASVGGKNVYAQRFAGPGLWGTITIILAVDAPVEHLMGLQVVSQNETPGLGGRIDEPWFKTQFKDEKIGPQGIRVVQGSGKGDKDPNNSQVDAVTGASRTSQSMEALVNRGIDDFRKAKNEGVLQ